MSDDTWLILGASSAVARAFAREAGGHGAGIMLAGRDLDDLDRQARDLRIRFDAAVSVLRFDALEISHHRTFVADCITRTGDSILHVFLAFGVMPDQAEADADPTVARRMIDANFTGAASILAALAPALEAQAGGAVVVLGSVAGDRGRKGNFLYGATKAALWTYLQGYAARLAKAHVRVLCIKAGPVDTGMTWPLAKLPFLISPRDFAAKVWRRAGTGSGSIYLPGIWWPVMSIIRLLPTPIFNRMNI